MSGPPGREGRAYLDRVAAVCPRTPGRQRTNGLAVPAEDDAPLSCDDTGFDLPDTVVRVDVTVTSATASAEGSGDVRYAPVFVNGAQCGVTCFDGVLLVGGGAGE